MITPEYLEYMLDTLTVHKELQESIIRDIVRRMVKNPSALTETAVWQLEKAQQSGLLYRDIVRRLSRETGRMESEIRRAFEDAEGEIFNYGDGVIRAAGLDAERFGALSPSMVRIWEAALSKTSTEAVNLTKTCAVTSQAAYIRACDLAHMQVSSGAFDYNTAIRNAVRYAAGQGVSVVYPSGYADRLDTAVRRSVLTGVNQTAGQLQTMRADELECDLMEITAHSGARPDHAEWQGRIVSRRGRRGYLSLSDIGYGTVTGFMGANCRHNWHMFFEGISVRAYTDAQLAALNGQTVRYEGEDVPLWRAVDYRRRLERSVKASKRELVALDEAIGNAPEGELRSGLKADFEHSSALLKKREEKLRDLCSQTGLRYDSSRCAAFSAETENGIKSWGRSTAQKAVAANKRVVVNTARFSDCVTNWTPLKGDVITTKSIYKELNKSEVGKSAMDYIASHATTVDIYYGKEMTPESTRGMAIGNHIYIYALNTKTIRKTAETIIHEVTHIERKIGGNQWAECVCFCQELKHTKKILTIGDLRNIIKTVKRLYPEYKWR